MSGGTFMLARSVLACSLVATISVPAASLAQEPCDAPSFERLGATDEKPLIPLKFQHLAPAKIEGRLAGRGQCGRLFIKEIDFDGRVTAFVGWGVSTLRFVYQPGMAPWGGYVKNWRDHIILTRTTGEIMDCKVKGKQWTCDYQYKGKTLITFEGSKI